VDQLLIIELVVTWERGSFITNITEMSLYHCNYGEKELQGEKVSLFYLV